MTGGTDHAYPFVFSADSPLLAVYRTLERVRETPTTVLIEGESGTGKDALAQWLHHSSPRKDAPCIKIDFSSLPEDLVESELFGYERGAFTGAITQKIGRFEVADQGSLFLDEIGDVPLELQPKLLRVLQEREFDRLGSTVTQKGNVRVIATTHRNLDEMIHEKQFRSDLYHRLNVFPIYIPPLRE